MSTVVHSWVCGKQVHAITGMRRGELLALRWADVDFDAGTVAVRRSATLIKGKGEGERIEVGLPKSGRPRVVDVDPQRSPCSALTGPPEAR